MTTQTICPICHTVFRISPSSLSESKGMVQCGVCGMVFDALKNVEADTSSGDEQQPSVQPAEDAESASPAVTDAYEHADAVQQDIIPVATPSLHDDLILSLPDNSNDIDNAADSAAYDVDSLTTPANNTESVVADTVPEVQFTAKSPSKHVWLWGSLSLAFAALLSVQFMILYRDKLAANFPAIAPALVALCDLSNCKVNLPKDANLIKISSTSFETDIQNPNLISVHIGLENQSDVTMAYPGLALSLTNDDDEVVVKRNFYPKDYLAKPSDIKMGIIAHTEVATNLTIDVSDLAVSGYKVLIY